MALGSKTYQKKILYIRIGLLIVGIGIFLMLLSIFDRIKIEREMADRRLQAEEEYYALEQRQLELKDNVEYLSKESSIESEIRKHFDVAREGEKVVVIMDDPATTSPIVPLTTQAPARPTPWYIFWR